MIRPGASERTRPSEVSHFWMDEALVYGSGPVQHSQSLKVQMT